MRNRFILASLRMAAACALVSLCAVPLLAQDDEAPAPRGARRPAGPPKPTPRWPDGTVNFGAPPGQKGNWDGGGLLATNPKNYEVLLGRRIPTGQVDIKDVPLQPWARALLDYRHAKFIADDWVFIPREGDRISGSPEKIGIKEWYLRDLPELRTRQK